MEHTSTKQSYAVITGRKVIFMARPVKTRQKHYREPVVVKEVYFKTKAEAMEAKEIWEQ